VRKSTGTLMVFENKIGHPAVRINKRIITLLRYIRIESYSRFLISVSAAPAE